MIKQRGLYRPVVPALELKNMMNTHSLLSTAEDYQGPAAAKFALITAIVPQLLSFPTHISVVRNLQPVTQIAHGCTTGALFGDERMMELEIGAGLLLS